MNKNSNLSEDLGQTSIDFFTKNRFFILIAFVTLGFLIRINYFPFHIPFEQDVLDFFEYAVKTKNLGMIPGDWFLANNGWSLFLATIFSFIHLDNFLDYVNLQRTISIIISVFVKSNIDLKSSK